VWQSAQGPEGCDGTLPSPGPHAGIHPFDWAALRGGLFSFGKRESTRLSAKKLRHCYDNVETMQRQCLPRQDTRRLPSRFPDEVIETMMDLLPSKVYGSNRAEIARSLIQDMLKRLAAENLVRFRGGSE
jgi:hypothetical protein